MAKYREWSIHNNPWPEPAWSAFGPNFDAELVVADSGDKVSADSYAELIEEIDNWIEEHEEPDLGNALGCPHCDPNPPE
jgi:hypothetical protein